MAWIEFWAYWSGVAAVGLTALAAIAGIVSWHLSNRVAELKDKELAAFQDTIRSATAAADARAAEANAAAAQATEGAAAANERTQRLEVEASQQRERAAKAEADLLKLQQRLAPRVVSEAAARELVERLRPFQGTPAEVFVASATAESSAFADRMIEILKAAGLKLSVKRVLFSAPHRPG
jgi:hypothetical protein